MLAENRCVVTKFEKENPVKDAEENGSIDLLNKFSDIQKLTVAVKKELYRLLVDEFDYFG